MPRLLEAKKVKFEKLTRGLLISGALGLIGCAGDIAVHETYYEDRHVRREYPPERERVRVEEPDERVSVRVDDRDAPRSRYDDARPPERYDSADRVDAVVGA